MRNIIIIFILGFLYGCVSAHVSMERSPHGDKYGPENYGKGVGVISYTTHGAAWVVENKREEAYKQMHETCKGHYVINKEYSGDKSGVIVPTTSGLFGVYRGKRFIEFECTK